MEIQLCRIAAGRGRETMARGGMLHGEANAALVLATVEEVDRKSAVHGPTCFCLKK